MLYDFSELHLTLPQVDLKSIDIDALLSINVDALEEDMKKQPLLHTVFSLIGRDAERQLANLMYQLDKVEAKIRQDIYMRTSFSPAGRITKERITDEFYNSPEWEKLKAKEQQLRNAVSILNTVEEGFRQRHSMLQQIAKRRSAELTQLN